MSKRKVKPPYSHVIGKSIGIGNLVSSDAEELASQREWAKKHSKQSLDLLVYKNTTRGSRHQAEALKMLETHLQRFTAQIKNITCAKCGDTLKCVRWTENEQIADTWGYMEFDDENVCHRCLDEGYIGNIYVPKKKS